MIFNIKINGINYFQTDQIVNATLGEYDSFPFQRTYDDIVEVIFTAATSAFPGYYSINDSDDDFAVFHSNLNNFYPVNQCLTVAPCDFKINPIGAPFPSGETVNIYINGVLKISGYTGSGPSATIPIQKGDYINVKVSGPSADDFGMTFVTTAATIDT